LIAALNDYRPKVKVEAISAISRRGTSGATATLTELAKNPAREVSAAALKALRDFGSPDMLPNLITLLVSIQPGERDEVISTVSEIARRGETEAQRTGVLLGRFEAATRTEDKIDLLSIAGEVGGPNALKAIRGAAASSSPELKLGALKILA